MKLPKAVEAEKTVGRQSRTESKLSEAGLIRRGETAERSEVFG